MEITISQLLTAATGRLLCPMEDVYRIYNFLTRDNLFTHQLPRAGREVEPWLFRWFPWLAAVDTRPLDALLAGGGDPQAACDAWVRSIIDVNHLLETVHIEPIPQDDHDRIDPIDEAVAMVGKDKVIVVRAEN